MTETPIRAAHTPGPWDIQYEDDALGNRSINVYPTCFGVISTGNHSQAVSMANARLIAAAPELLAALKDSVNQLETSPYWIEQIMGKSSPAIAGILQTCRNARAAIAKAEGK